jgi:hypothetical protein
VTSHSLLSAKIHDTFAYSIVCTASRIKEDKSILWELGFFGGLALRREQIGELLIFKERSEFVSHFEIGIAFGKGGPGNAGGLFRHRKGDFDLVGT